MCALFSPEISQAGAVNGLMCVFFLVVVGHFWNVQKRLERTNIDYVPPSPPSLINREMFLWALSTVKQTACPALAK